LTFLKFHPICILNICGGKGKATILSGKEWKAQNWGWSSKLAVF
jgi:hypothetical protein